MDFLTINSIKHSRGKSLSSSSAVAWILSVLYQPESSLLLPVVAYRPVLLMILGVQQLPARCHSRRNGPEQASCICRGKKMANSLFVDGIHLIGNLIREACLANWILQPKSNQTRNIYEMVSVPYIALQCKSCQPIVDVYSFVIRFLLQSLTVSETGQFNQTLSFVLQLWALTIGMCSVQSHIMLELWCPCTWSTEMTYSLVCF